MGFGRKKKKNKKVWIFIFFILISLGGLALGGYYLYQQSIASIENQYTQVINELTKEKESYIKLALVPKSDLESGQIITDENCEIKEIVTNLMDKNYVTPNDYNSVLLVGVDSGNPLMKNMIINEKVEDEIREQEMGMLMLPSNIKPYDYIDVRIGFSNGEDYIVLSKKMVQDVDNEANTLWTWLDESEILTLSSAIVDAYIHEGTKLYALTYVSPEIQEAAIVNYPVNTDVEALLINNPNIVDEASLALNTNARIALETKLEYISDENTQNIASGINNEESNRAQVNITNEDNTVETVKEIKEQENADEVPSQSNELNIAGESSLKNEKTDVNSQDNKDEEGEGKNGFF